MPDSGFCARSFNVKIAMINTTGMANLQSADHFHQQNIYWLWRTLVIAVGCTVPLFGSSTGLPTTEDPRVLPVYHSDRIWNGVATTREGEVFACYPSIEGFGPQLEQLKPQDVAVPWPNDAWNSWKPGKDFAGDFVHINAIRTGPDGILWAVDAGAPGFGQPAIHGAARLIGFDTSTGQLERVYSLSAGAKPTSYINDVRFNGRHAYLPDTGAPALLVLDLDSGAV